MDASDLIKALQIPCEEGAAHIWKMARRASQRLQRHLRLQPAAWFSCSSYPLLLAPTEQASSLAPGPNFGVRLCQGNTEKEQNVPPPPPQLS